VRQGVITLCGLAEYYATFIKELDDFEIDMIERLHKIRSELDPDFELSEDTSFQGSRAGFNGTLTPKPEG
jgi:hypothetical protein